MLSRRNFHGFPVAARRVPVLGHYLALDRDPWGFLRSQIDAHGNLFWVDTGFGSWTLMAHGEDAFRSLIATTDYRRSQRSMAREFGWLMGRRVVSGLDGAEHRRVRGAMVGALSKLGELAPLVEGHAERSVAELVASDGRILAQLARDFAMSVILGLLGISASYAAQWQRVFSRFTLGFVPLKLEGVGSPRWLALRARRWIDARLAQQIAEARAGRVHGLLATLVAEQEDRERGLDDEELMDNLRNLITAGFHTSAQGITWALSYLATDRRLWDGVAGEVRALDELPRSVGAISALPFLGGLVRETLRLRPVMLGLSRGAGEGLVVDGRPIPEGIKLTVPLTTLLTESKRYPAPMLFDPLRWSRLGRPIDRLDNAGFGGGAHYCAGNALAMLEMSTYVATLVRAADRRGLRPHLARLPRTRLVGPALEVVTSETRVRWVPVP